MRIAGNGSAFCGGFAGGVFGFSWERLRIPSCATMAFTEGASISMSANEYARCQIEDNSKSTNNRRKPSSFSPLRAASEKSLISSWNKKGLTRISPTVGVASTVFGISSISAERRILGASTNPASAYSATSNATTAEIRKALDLVNCSTGHPAITPAVDSELSLANKTLALVALDQPLALAHLTRRQGISLAGERVLVAAERDAYRRAHQIERLAIDIDQIAAVGVRHVIGLIAVDDDDGRIAAALVGVTQLDAAAADQRRLMAFDRRFQHPRQFRGAHVAGGGGIHLAHGGE